MKYLTKDPSLREGGVGAASLTPKSLQEAVVRYRGWVVLTMVAVTTLVTLWTLRTPKIYQAVTTLEYEVVITDIKISPGTIRSRYETPSTLRICDPRNLPNTSR